MKRLFPLFLLVSLYGTAQVKKKFIVYDQSLSFHKGYPIYTTAFRMDDSTTDEELIRCLDSSIILGPRYVLYKDDSTRYGAMIYKSFYPGKNYVVSRVRRDGYPMRMTFYDAGKKKNSIETVYSEKFKMESYGRWKHGIKKGKWRYYNNKGKKIKVEKYREGKLIRTKEFTHPRFALNNLILRHTLIPSYTIRDKDEPFSDLKFPKDSLKVKRLWSIGIMGGISVHHFDSLRTRPWLFGRPPDLTPEFGSEINIGNREKFFLTGSLFTWFGKTVTGNCTYYNSVYVAQTAISGYRYEIGLTVPFYKSRKMNISVFGGYSSAGYNIESKNLSLSNSSVTSYFDIGTLKNKSLLTGAISFELMNRDRHYFNPALTLKAGYNYGLKESSWYYGKTLLFFQPHYSLNGFYVSLVFRQWWTRRA